MPAVRCVCGVFWFDVSVYSHAANSVVIIGPSALQTYIVEVADKEDVRQLGARVHAMLRLGDEKKLSFMASALWRNHAIL